MKLETITENDALLIRRMILSPGEAMFWHHDTCERFTVVVRGSRLAIEYQASGAIEEFDVHPGLAGWDAPEERIHRAINPSDEVYEEIVTFYKDTAATIPQPKV